MAELEIQYRIESRKPIPTDNGYALTGKFTEWDAVGSYWTTDEYWAQIITRLDQLRRDVESAWIPLKSTNDGAVEQTVIQLMVKQGTEYRVVRRVLPEWDPILINDQDEVPELVEDLMREQVTGGPTLEKL